MDPRSKTVVVSHCNQIAARIKAEFGPNEVIIVNGTSFKAEDLAARFSARADAAEKTMRARVAFRSAVSAERKVEDDVRNLRQWFRTFLEARYGKYSPSVGSFGYPPAHAPVKSVATKRDAAEKALATRKLRKTMGKRQKAAIKGTPSGE